MLCSARVDGLSKRELTATEMAEHYEGRADFLYHRLTTYAKPVRRAPQQQQQQQRREIVVSSNHTHTLSLYTERCMMILLRVLWRSSITIRR